jgi:hypothetical protein
MVRETQKERLVRVETTQIYILEEMRELKELNTKTNLILENHTKDDLRMQKETINEIKLLGTSVHDSIKEMHEVFDHRIKPLEIFRTRVITVYSSVMVLVSIAGVKIFDLFATLFGSKGN